MGLCRLSMSFDRPAGGRDGEAAASRYCIYLDWFIVLAGLKGG